MRRIYLGAVCGLFLLIGSLPGVFLGAQISSRTTAPWLRPILAAVLLASALKLLNAPSVATGVAALIAAVVLVSLPKLLQRIGVPEWVAGRTSRETASRANLSEV